MWKDHLFRFYLSHTNFYDFQAKKASTPNESAGVTKKEQSNPVLSCRHVVAFMGFMAYFFLGMQRMNMSIAIVAMVKKVGSVNDSVKSSESCPELHPKADNSTSAYKKNTEGDFNWSPELQGYILGSLFVGYSLTLLLGGKMSERFGCKWIFFLGMLLSSLATLFTPFVSWWNVYVLIAVQTIKGMSQGVLTSSVSVLGANWFPRVERGCLFGFVLSGNSGGVLAGGLVTGYLCQASFAGWPVVFYSCGAAGLCFALVVAIFVFENPSVHPRITDNERKFILSNQENTLTERRPQTPWLSFFTSVPVYALAIAFLGQFWVGTHFYSIHPAYLDTIFHIPMTQNGLFSSLPFLLQFVFAFFASLISNILSKKNYASINTVRKLWNSMACIGYSACLIGIYLSGCNKVMVIGFSVLAMASTGCAFAGSMIVPADMTPTFAGTLMGLVTTIGSSSGFLLPFITGILTDEEQTLEQWNKIMFISVGVAMSSGIIFCVFGSAEVQSWNFVGDNNTNDVEKQKASS